ncbi:hypothetical protein MIND_00843100 [Mycena indigotica]|uniref:Transmembrane protein n=1 Tax=Mycena indigotica TaxID=2126181 RepID=A0A8H6SHM0_9AGAR|nr:uncharacterized protein MIND_00843100 [Mycena indigotica]KAF7298950.1 hypothetical protein MIND_00843100 [Mycena indigotica]
MVSTNLTLIVDDHDARIVYHCPSTKEIVRGSYFRNTWTTPGSLSCGLEYGWFSFQFNGTGVRIATLDSQINDQYSVKIDNGSFVGQRGNGFFESNVLEDGPHTVIYSSGNLSVYPAFDYITISAGPSTQLFGESIIVDDGQVANFSGKWNAEPAAAQQNLLGQSLNVYQNTTRWTNATGDAFSFDFEGTSIGVYGIIPETNMAPGNSTIACSVDGVVNSSSLPKGTLSPHPMVQLCQADVPAGRHNFMLNFTHVVPSHSYGFDFIVYNSSVHTSPPPGAALQQSPQSHSHSKTHNIGVIVGSTLGALAALTLFCVLVLFVYRRRKTPQSKWTASKADS